MPTKAIEAPENNEKPVKVPVGAVRASAENRGEESWYTLFRLVSSFVQFKPSFNRCNFEIDHDNDGLVPLVELQTAITNSAKMLGLNQEEASMLLVDLGQNNDKLVDFGEFSAMVSINHPASDIRFILDGKSEEDATPASGLVCNEDGYDQRSNANPVEISSPVQLLPAPIIHDHNFVDADCRLFLLRICFRRQTFT